MQMNTLPQPSVGAALSRPPPIYRPSVTFHYPDDKGCAHLESQLPSSNYLPLSYLLIFASPRQVATHQR